MYPRLNSWVVVEKEETGDSFLLTDHMYDDVYRIDPQTAALVSRLDGETDPYGVDCGLSREEITEALDYFREEFLVRERHFLSGGFGSVYLPLYTFPRDVRTTVPRALATLLWLGRPAKRRHPDGVLPFSDGFSAALISR